MGGPPTPCPAALARTGASNAKAATGLRCAPQPSLFLPACRDTPFCAAHIVPIQSCWLLRRIGPYWVCDAAVARSTTFTLRRKQLDACMHASHALHICMRGRTCPGGQP
jgi:hypothetical protein